LKGQYNRNRDAKNADVQVIDSILFYSTLLVPPFSGISPARRHSLGICNRG
jgi:hypothetical protein